MRIADQFTHEQSEDEEHKDGCHFPAKSCIPILLLNEGCDWNFVYPVSKQPKTK